MTAMLGSLILPVTIILYVIGSLKFYKHELVAFFFGDGGRPEEPPPLEVMPTVMEITTELKNMMVLAHDGEINGDELAARVEDVLGRYPYVKGTPYQEVIHSFLNRCYAITTPLPSKNL